MARVLFHVDLNAFFAACEISQAPWLANQPVAVSHQQGRSVILTANYVAREFGVRSAMPLSKAIQLCENLVVVEPHFDLYKAKSEAFIQLLYEFTNQVEQASIDEAYLDMTDAIQKAKRPLDVAFRLQESIRQRLGLDVSIGIGPTRFLAKMASDMKKPRGITVLRKSELANKLWPLPIDAMLGIGKRSLPKLKEAGLMTIGDLVHQSDKLAKLTSDKMAMRLRLAATGHSGSQLSYSTSRKTISSSRTFAVDVNHLEELRVMLNHECEAVHHDLLRLNVKTKWVSLTLRDSHFKTLVRSHTLNEPTQSLATIKEVSNALLDQYYQGDDYRLIGVSLGSLSSDQISQPTLFEPVSIVELLNQKMPEAKLTTASALLDRKKHED